MIMKYVALIIAMLVGACHAMEKNTDMIDPSIVYNTTKFYDKNGKCIKVYMEDYTNCGLYSAMIFIEEMDDNELKLKLNFYNYGSKKREKTLLDFNRFATKNKETKEVLFDLNNNLEKDIIALRLSE